MNPRPRYDPDAIVPGTEYNLPQPPAPNPVRLERELPTAELVLVLPQRRLKPGAAVILRALRLLLAPFGWTLARLPRPCFACGHASSAHDHGGCEVADCDCYASAAEAAGLATCYTCGEPGCEEHAA